MKLTILLALGLAALTSSALAGERKVSPAKEAVFTNLFNEADTSGDGRLSAAEFAGSYGASERPVITEIRFQRLSRFFDDKDTRGDIPLVRFVFLPEFIEANGGRKITPSKLEIFEAADDNDNNFLSLSEFFATRIQSASSEASAAKAFDKMDKNDDNQISPAEFGVSIVPV